MADRLGAPMFVGAELMIALVLALADRQQANRPVASMRTADSPVVGVAQAITPQPGVSRPGATIAAVRVLGSEREDAGRLTFLLSVPLIAGAMAYEALALRAAGVDEATAATMAIGAVAAAVTIRLVLAVVRSRSFLPFVAYRLGLGAAVIVAGAVR